MKYVPGIDGLRAVAVLSVLMFHAGIPKLDGGFVGVDVFFVISGYLITRLITDEIERTGGFDFGRFYYRRARRLLPALFFTLIFTLAVALILFTPQHLQRFGGELLYSVFSLSNFFFWSEAGYFDAASDFKPLLHTWSLSVEEQFYLLWPLALAALYAKRRISIVMAGVAAIFFTSLLLNMAFTGGLGVISSFITANVDGLAAIYFLTPFRAFEFAIGAALVWVPRLHSGARSDALMAMGLALIVWSVFAFNEATVFPSLNALLPCLGAALCIASSNSRRVGALLSNPASVFVGRISYSVYLAHWPIISFSKYWLMRDLYMSEKLGVIAASMMAGYAMYAFVEQRFRHEGHPTSKPAYGLKCALAALMLCLPAATIWASNGWEWRVPELPAELAAQLSDSKQFHKDQYGGAGFSSNGWISGNGKEPADLVVIGDSHAKQYATGLTLALSQGLNIYMVSASCLVLPDMTRLTGGLDWDTKCPGALQAALSVIDRSPNAAIMIAERWHSQMKVAATLTNGMHLADMDMHDRAVFTAGKIKQLAKMVSPRQVIVFGSVPETSAPDAIGCFNRPLSSTATCERMLSRPLKDHRTRWVNDIFSELLSGQSQLHFIDPYKALCDEKNCRALSSGRVLYSDANHLSKSGSSEVVSYFRNDLLRVIAIGGQYNQTLTDTR